MLNKIFLKYPGVDNSANTINLASILPFFDHVLLAWFQYSMYQMDISVLSCKIS